MGRKKKSQSAELDGNGDGELRVKKHPLTDEQGVQYIVDYPFDVSFPLYESAIYTCKQVYELQGAPRLDGDGVKKGKRGRKSVDEENNDTAIQRLAHWIIEQYGHDVSKIGMIDPQEATWIVMGELQLDHARIVYRPETSEKGAEIVENLQTRQSNRINKTVGNTATRNASSGPSETKEKPAPRPSKGSNGSTKAKPAAPTVRTPAKTNKTERKATTAKAAPAAKRGRPAKAAPAQATKRTQRAAAQETVARKSARGGKVAAEKVSRGATRTRAAAPAKAAAGYVNTRLLKGDKPLSGKSPENMAAVEYINTRLLKGDKPERIAKNLQEMKRFANTPAALNPMASIYRSRSKLYLSGQLKKPAGIQGRKSFAEIEKANAKAGKRGRK